MEEIIFKNFERHFPRIAEEAIDWYKDSAFELVVKLRDGSVVMYDDLNACIRNLPRDDKRMSEEECKREFGIRLRRLMYINGVTQEDIMRETGIAQPTLSRYMNGENIPSFYKVDQIAKALNCSVDEFRYLLK